MPVTKCEYCGRMSNSAVSNYWHETEMDGKTSKAIGIITRCFAAFVDEKWVQGCAYNDIDVDTKILIDKFLGS